MNACKGCGSPTKNPKFCSRSCAASSNNRGVRRNRPRERTCRSCGASYVHTYTGKGHRGPRRCSECVERGRTKYRHMTLGEYRRRMSVKGKHPSWVHAHVRNFCRTWNNNLRSQPCEVCGYSKHVELAHIRPLSAWGDDAILEEVNAPSNIRVLCPNHHWEFDNGLLGLKSAWLESNQLPPAYQADALTN